MKGIFSIILFFTFFTLSFLSSRNFGVEVRPVDEEFINAFPKEVVTMKFSVTNTTSRRHNFESEVKLPKNWKLISMDFPFELESNHSIIKVISFFIPDSVNKTKYEVKFRVMGREFPSLSDEIKICVVVRDSAKTRQKKNKKNYR
jgi:hypothetical protein